MVKKLYSYFAICVCISIWYIRQQCRTPPSQYRHQRQCWSPMETLHPDTNNSICSNPIQSPSALAQGHMVVVVVRGAENFKKNSKMRNISRLCLYTTKYHLKQNACSYRQAILSIASAGFTLAATAFTAIAAVRPLLCK